MLVPNFMRQKNVVKFTTISKHLLLRLIFVDNSARKHLICFIHFVQRIFEKEYGIKTQILNETRFVLVDTAKNLNHDE